MAKWFRGVLLIATIAVVALPGGAQAVAMAGQYHEAVSLDTYFPLNPPLVPCNTTANDARCIRREQQFFGFPFDAATVEPQVGVRGAGLVNGGLSIGASFTIPPLFFQQRLGQQVEIVVEKAVRQLDTAFTAFAPATNRAKGANPSGTRLFRANDYAQTGNNQDNGLTPSDAAYTSRTDAAFVRTHTVANETLAMNYTPSVGGNAFGGTAGLLLEGRGRSYVAGPQISHVLLVIGLPSLNPAIGTASLGNASNGPHTRAGAGFDYTVMGMQAAGLLRGFPAPGHATAVLAPPCIGTTSGTRTPIGCNEINDFDLTTMGGQAPPQGAGTGPRVYGVSAGPYRGADSTRHLFAWTTGTVSIVRTGIRDGNTQTETLTGMGYDTTAMSSMGAITARNVGLVAGSYTIREYGNGSIEIEPHLAGMNLQFTPEPGATIALVSGLALLAGLAHRQGRYTR